MIRLGSITIGGSASVVEARKKIRTVAIQLDCDEVEATRLATATSEIVRLYAQEGTTPRLEVSCDAQRPGTEIVLDFLDPEARPDVGHLVRFFDRIEYLAGEGETRVQRAIASMSPRSELRKSEIAKLEAIVQKKGRDELIAEIQKKNIELQESLDNLRRTRSAKERMESELNIGAEIQMSMLPLVFPAFPERADFDVYAALEPAREVGGDFYDFFLIDEDHLCVCIGDVSGKGVPAALFMAVTKTLVKSRASTDPSTASILGHVNQEMSQNNKESMFVTVFLGILRISTGEFIYSNAGHNPPYLLRGSGELIRLDRRHGPILGAVEGLSYGEDRLKVGNQETLFLYTDGVTEAMNSRSSLYDEDRLQRILKSGSGHSVEKVVNSVLEDVWEFQGDAEQADDVTIMAVSYTGSSPEEASKSLALRIENNFEEIEHVNEAFNAFAEAYDIPDTIRRKLNLVFDELLNNIISYGYADDATHWIEIGVSVVEGVLVVSITDDGRPFNPTETPTPNIDVPLEEREVGGLGLHLMKSLMDEVTYERQDTGNLVTLKKRLPFPEE